jgi:hypothetical protein
LHDANIFHHAGQYQFYDWGDASLSHPFFSLRTAYVSAEIRFGLEENDPSLVRLRDAYLAAWRDYASETDLRDAFALAQSLWAISSALSWQQVVDASTGYDHVLPALMEEFLDSNP